MHIFHSRHFRRQKDKNVIHINNRMSFRCTKYGAAVTKQVEQVS